jgi:hypothetical protein
MAIIPTVLNLRVMLRIHKYWSMVFPCSKAVTCT